MEMSEIRDVDGKSFLDYLNHHEKFVFYKAFSEARFALCFANGNAWASRLSAFREPQCPKDGRSDENDGVKTTAGTATLSPNGALILVGETDYGKITVTLPDHKDIKTKYYLFHDISNCVVFCLSGLGVGDSLSQNELEQCLLMGHYFVVIEEPINFIKSMIKTGNFVNSGWIDYSGSTNHNALFSKRAKYSHEHEYRFVFKEDKINCEKGNIAYESVPCSVFHIVGSPDK